MNYAVVEEGLVSNVIWLNDSNADEFPTPYLWAMFLPVLAIRTTARISTATGKGYEPCWNRRKRKRRTCARRSRCWA